MLQNSLLLLHPLLNNRPSDVNNLLLLLLHSNKSKITRTNSKQAIISRYPLLFIPDLALPFPNSRPALIKSDLKILFAFQQEII